MYVIIGIAIILFICISAKFVLIEKQLANLNKRLKVLEQLSGVKIDDDNLF